MGDAIGQVLAFAVAVALSPIPIIGVVLILTSPTGHANGLAFLAGSIFGIAALGTIVLVAAGGGNASESGQPADWVSILKLVLGLLFLGLALKSWRGRPRGDEEPELPSWMNAVDDFTPARAAAIGAALSSINPKNLMLIIGGAATIAQTGASSGDQAIALAVFTVIASLGVAIPVAIDFLMGERATAVLAGLRDWMARESAAIMVVICLLIGAKLIGDAISGLAA